MSLPVRQELFTLEYLKDFNATKAAIRAGYAESGAHTEGHRLLKNAEIQKRISEHLESAGVNTQRILGELTKIAYANPEDFIDIDEDTGSIRAKGFEQMPPGGARSIKRVKETRKITESKDGERLFVDITTEIEHHDKLKALELLGKHTGAFKDSVHISGNMPVVPVQIVGKDAD